MDLTAEGVADRGLGAHRILFWATEHDAASPEAFAALEDAVTALGGADPQPWIAQAALHRAAPPTSIAESREQKQIASTRDMHIVTFTEGGASGDQLYLVNRHGQQVIMAAGADVKSLLDSYMQLKTRASISLEGTRYRAGDFRIALLRALERPANRFKGLAVVIEYVPVGNGTAAAAVLEEMEERLREAALASFPNAQVVAIPDIYRDYGLSEGQYSTMHLAVQLVQLGCHMKAV